MSLHSLLLDAFQSTRVELNSPLFGQSPLGLMLQWYIDHYPPFVQTRKRRRFSIPNSYQCILKTRSAPLGPVSPQVKYCCACKRGTDAVDAPKGPRPSAHPCDFHQQGDGQLSDRRRAHQYPQHHHGYRVHWQHHVPKGPRRERQIVPYFHEVHLQRHQEHRPKQIHCAHPSQPSG